MNRLLFYTLSGHGLVWRQATCLAVAVLKVLPSKPAGKLHFSHPPIRRVSTGSCLSETLAIPRPSESWNLKASTGQAPAAKRDPLTRAARCLEGRSSTSCVAGSAWFPTPDEPFRDLCASRGGEVLVLLFFPAQLH